MHATRRVPEYFSQLRMPVSRTGDTQGFTCGSHGIDHDGLLFHAITHEGIRFGCAVPNGKPRREQIRSRAAPEHEMTDDDNGDEVSHDD